MSEAGQNEHTIIGGRYRMIPGVRLEEFDRPHVEAFGAEDLREKDRPLIALVARRGRPVRDDWLRVVRRIDQPPHHEASCATHELAYRQRASPGARPESTGTLGPCPTLRRGVAMPELLTRLLHL